MSLDDVLVTARSLPGVLELAPAEGGEWPEIAWGDHFFYLSPDGTVPQATQPYATVVTKNYPDDVISDLDGEGRWRLNLHVGRARAAQVLGGEGDDAVAAADADPAEADALRPHPLYGSMGWVSVVCPGERTLPLALELLREAHESARRRAERRDAEA